VAADTGGDGTGAVGRRRELAATGRAQVGALPGLKNHEKL
jgi:hypothetical protein